MGKATYLTCFLKGMDVTEDKDINVLVGFSVILWKKKNAFPRINIFCYSASGPCSDLSKVFGEFTYPFHTTAKN